MERRAVNLSFQRSEEYEFGAALLPQEKSEVRLGDLHGSLCARALWVRHLAHPDDTTAITAKPQYIFRDTQGIERHVKFVSKRLAEIFVAGRMMIPFLKRATMGEAANLPSDVTILSINWMAAFVLDDAEQSDVSNVKTRYWAAAGAVGWMHAGHRPFLRLQSVDGDRCERRYPVCILRLTGGRRGGALPP